MQAQDLALQRDKYRHLSDTEWRWWLQQVEGRERTADKLPSFAAMEDWWYPVRLSCEQCSSEIAARYKTKIITAGSRFVDLTGGYGVDTFFLSRAFTHTDYVEKDPELCRIAAHNFNLQYSEDSRQSSNIRIHNTTAEDFLSSCSQKEDEQHFDLIFLDPARRDTHGGKVFRLEDCTPDIVSLLSTLLCHLKPNGRILLKLSPMLDLTQALRTLDAVSWDVFVVSVKNEVKELLLLSGGTGLITAVDLSDEEKTFVFTREEESLASSVIQKDSDVSKCYLYEPAAAILKSGAYKLVGHRFGLHKLDINTHLYVSDTLRTDFPGRIWYIQSPVTNHAPISKANVLVRNYPLTAEQLKKKLKLQDGSNDFVIGCRINGKPTVWLAKRI